MTADQAYRYYRADDNLSALSYKLLRAVMEFQPASVLDFGCGSGKHCDWLRNNEVVTHGVDISPVNVSVAMYKHDLPFISLGNQDHLRFMTNYDCVITCSVLDHIESVELIIEDFKRIANKAIILAEPLHHDPDNFYYAHDYESMGFHKVETGYVGEDGNEYFLFVWVKNN
jgi:2-polyprenyl-3-methyl-5-hydroxy-6-metoxy-1,4-benzoquinol methylase